ncbi:MAG: hypothetical protein ACOCP8_05330, partial [archaeon]
MEQKTHLLLLILVMMLIGAGGYPINSVLFLFALFATIFPNFDKKVEWLSHRGKTHSLIIGIIFSI